MSSMTGRERVRRALSRIEPDRVPVFDQYWQTTLRRWRAEGLPTHTDPADFFGHDIVLLRCDQSPQWTPRLLQETAEYTIVLDSYGTTVKTYRYATSTPGWLGHSVKTSAQYDAIRERFAWNDERIELASLRAQYDKARAAGRFVFYSGAISWDFMLPLVGADVLLTAMAEEPDWVGHMFDDAMALYIRGYERLTELGFAFDGAWVFDDMAYRGGPLFSPAMYDALFCPIDRAVCLYFHERGLPLLLHSCGDIRMLLPRLIESGYDAIQPLETKAGMDVRSLKTAYGDRLAFMGGIDVRTMRDADRIEAEIRDKLKVAMTGGGYIYHSDHTVPDDVSLEQYQTVMRLVQQYGRYGAC